MSDLHDDGEVDGELGELGGWEQPALQLRIGYDEQGRISTVVTEYRDMPSADDLARLVAQFLTLRPGQMPNRRPGVNLPRDPKLERQFRAVIGQCTATQSTAGDHTHACEQPAGGHAERHNCECGSIFGG